MGLWHKALGTLPGLRGMFPLSGSLGVGRGEAWRGSWRLGRELSSWCGEAAKDMGLVLLGKEDLLLVKMWLAGRGTARELELILAFLGWKLWIESQSLSSTNAEFHFENNPKPLWQC